MLLGSQLCWPMTIPWGARPPGSRPAAASLRMPTLTEQEALFANALYLRKLVALCTSTDPNDRFFFATISQLFEQNLEKLDTPAPAIPSDPQSQDLQSALDTVKNVSGPASQDATTALEKDLSSQLTVYRSCLLLRGEASELGKPTSEIKQFLTQQKINHTLAIYNQINVLSNTNLATPPDAAMDVVDNLIALRSLKLLHAQHNLRTNLYSYVNQQNYFSVSLNGEDYQTRGVYFLKDLRYIEESFSEFRKHMAIVEHEARKQFATDLSNYAIQVTNNKKRKLHDRYRFHQNLKKHLGQVELEQRKKLDSAERERLRALVECNDEEYSKLVKQKKDKRLMYLLAKTEEYINSFTSLVMKRKEEALLEAERLNALAVQNAPPPVATPTLPQAPIVSTAPSAPSSEPVQAADLADQEPTTTTIEQHTLAPEITTDVDGITLSITNPEIKDLQEPPTASVAPIASTTSNENESIRTPATEDTTVTLQPGQTSDLKKEDIIPEPASLPKTNVDQALKQITSQDSDDVNKKVDPNLYMTIAHAIGEQITEQPVLVEGGTLKPYQMRGLEWLVSLHNNKLNGILADEMGLGKTIQSLSLIAYLIGNKKFPGPYLIVVPLSTISNWQLEAAAWIPKVSMLTYKGSKDERKKLNYLVKKRDFQVLLTTYEYIIKDKSILSKINWKYLIVDEGHRIKNHNAKLTMVLANHYKIDHRLLLTGTPLQNRLPELWALMNFLLPDIFSSGDSFEEWFSKPFADMGEDKQALNQEESILVIRALHKVLSPFLLRRLKKDVESQLPQKIEYVIKIGLTPLQEAIYGQIKDHAALLTQGDSGSVKTSTIKNGIMQLRKVCNHPYLFTDLFYDAYDEKTGTMIPCPASTFKTFSPAVPGDHLFRVSGKFELLDHILIKLQRTNHRVLLFCQMTQLLLIMEEYLRWKGMNFLKLDGSTKAEDRASMIKQFNAPDSPYFIFILSTRAGGLGLNLQTADTVVIFDSDWNPHQDLQAQDRAHRIGQKNEVRVLRFMCAGTIEEHILASARSKLHMDAKVIQAGKFDQKTTNDDRQKVLELLVQKDRDYTKKLNRLRKVREEERKKFKERQRLNERIALKGELPIFDEEHETANHGTGAMDPADNDGLLNDNGTASANAAGEDETPALKKKRGRKPYKHLLKTKWEKELEEVLGEDYLDELANENEPEQQHSTEGMADSPNPMAAGICADDDEEEEVDSPHTLKEINEFLARDKKELAFFAEIDQELLGQYSNSWENRTISLSEIPDSFFLHQKDRNGRSYFGLVGAGEEEEVLYNESGRRKRKATASIDALKGSGLYDHNSGSEEFYDDLHDEGGDGVQMGDTEGIDNHFSDELMEDHEDLDSDFEYEASTSNTRGRKPRAKMEDEEIGEELHSHAAKLPKKRGRKPNSETIGNLVNEQKGMLSTIEIDMSSGRPLRKRAKHEDDGDFTTTPEPTRAPAASKKAKRRAGGPGRGKIGPIGGGIGGNGPDDPSLGLSEENKKNYLALDAIMLLTHPANAKIFLFQPFYKIPSRSMYPDYYQIIRRPIDLLTIKNRIFGNIYSTTKYFMLDIDLLVTNATTYNHPSSQIYHDALAIKKCAEETLASLLVTPQSPEAAPEVSEKEGQVDVDVEKIEGEEGDHDDQPVDIEQPLDSGAPAPELQSLAPCPLGPKGLDCSHQDTTSPEAGSMHSENHKDME